MSRQAATKGNLGYERNRLRLGESLVSAWYKTNYRTFEKLTCKKLQAIVLSKYTVFLERHQLDFDRVSCKYIVFWNIFPD